MTIKPENICYIPPEIEKDLPPKVRDAALMSAKDEEVHKVVVMQKSFSPTSGRTIYSVKYYYGVTGQSNEIEFEEKKSLE